MNVQNCKYIQNLENDKYNSIWKKSANLLKLLIFIKIFKYFMYTDKKDS